MPIYEYQCEACQHHLEALQKISDAPLRKCPDCGRPKLKRLISPPVFRLKGSGWYETDFKSDKDSRRNLAVEKDEAPAVASTESTPSAPKAADAKAPAATPVQATPGEGGAKAASPARKPASPHRARPHKAPARKRPARK